MSSIYNNPFSNSKKPKSKRPVVVEEVKEVIDHSRPGDWSSIETKNVADLNSLSVQSMPYTSTLRHSAISGAALTLSHMGFAIPGERYATKPAVNFLQQVLYKYDGKNNNGYIDVLSELHKLGEMDIKMDTSRWANLEDAIEDHKLTVFQGGVLYNNSFIMRDSSTVSRRTMVTMSGNNKKNVVVPGRVGSGIAYDLTDIPGGFDTSGNYSIVINPHDLPNGMSEFRGYTHITIEGTRYPMFLERGYEMKDYTADQQTGSASLVKAPLGSHIFRAGVSIYNPAAIEGVGSSNVPSVATLGAEFPALCAFIHFLVNRWIRSANSAEPTGKGAIQCILPAGGEGPSYGPNSTLSNMVYLPSYERSDIASLVCWHVIAVMLEHGRPPLYMLPLAYNATTGHENHRRSLAWICHHLLLEVERTITLDTYAVVSERVKSTQGKILKGVF